MAWKLSKFVLWTLQWLSVIRPKKVDREGRERGDEAELKLG